MKLIAKKPCSFGGKKFYIGDEIPVESVLDPKAQEKMGVLVLVDEAQGRPAPALAPAVVLKEVDTMPVVIGAKEGDLLLNLTQAGLQAVVDVLTVKPAEAVSIIEKMEDGDALILVHIMDSRKAVKEATEARAKALNTEEDEAQTPSSNSEESAGEQ